MSPYFNPIFNNHTNYIYNTAYPFISTENYLKYLLEIVK